MSAKIPFDDHHFPSPNSLAENCPDLSSLLISSVKNLWRWISTIKLFYGLQSFQGEIPRCERTSYSLSLCSFLPDVLESEGKYLICACLLTLLSNGCGLDAVLNARKARYQSFCPNWSQFAIWHSLPFLDKVWFHFEEFSSALPLMASDEAILWSFVSSLNTWEMLWEDLLFWSQWKRKGFHCSIWSGSKQTKRQLSIFPWTNKEQKRGVSSNLSVKEFPRLARSSVGTNPTKKTTNFVFG